MTHGVIIAALLGSIGLSMGFVAGVATRRYAASLAGGALGVGTLYFLYVLTTGEGSPFVSYVVVAGAIGASLLLGGFGIGVAIARAFDRRTA